MRSGAQLCASWLSISSGAPGRARLLCNMHSAAGPGMTAAVRALLYVLTCSKAAYQTVTHMVSAAQAELATARKPPLGALWAAGISARRTVWPQQTMAPAPAVSFPESLRLTKLASPGVCQCRRCTEARHRLGWPYWGWPLGKQALHLRAASAWHQLSTAAPSACHVDQRPLPRALQVVRQLPVQSSSAQAMEQKASQSCRTLAWSGPANLQKPAPSSGGCAGAPNSTSGLMPTLLMSVPAGVCTCAQTLAACSGIVSAAVHAVQAPGAGCHAAACAHRAAGDLAASLQPWLVGSAAQAHPVAGSRDDQCGAVGELHDGLDEALAKGGLPHDGGAPVVLQRAGQHLHSTCCSCCTAWGTLDHFLATGLQGGA